MVVVGSHRYYSSLGFVSLSSRPANPRPGDTFFNTTLKVLETWDGAVWLASSAEVASLTGRFWELRKEQPCQFRSEETEEKLWEACERMVDQR